MYFGFQGVIFWKVVFSGAQEGVVCFKEKMNIWLLWWWWWEKWIVYAWFKQWGLNWMGFRWRWRDLSLFKNFIWRTLKWRKVLRLLEGFLRLLRDGGELLRGFDKDSFEHWLFWLCFESGEGLADFRVYITVTSQKSVETLYMIGLRYWKGKGYAIALIWLRSEFDWGIGNWSRCLWWEEGLHYFCEPVYYFSFSSDYLFFCFWYFWVFFVFFIDSRIRVLWWDNPLIFSFFQLQRR